jgi:hypothetical protein
MKVSDYFAELYVAGRFAGAGWNVYFPRRDRGFDFIVSRPAADGLQLIRPVQVKGKYPTPGKGDKVVYGYIRDLTKLHPEMVLAIPFFSAGSPEIPTCVAYLPRSLVCKHSRGFKCQPATFRVGSPIARREFAKFFDEGASRLSSSRTGARLRLVARPNRALQATVSRAAPERSSR